MLTTPFDAKMAGDTVLVRLGSTGLHLEFPEGTRELAPGTDLVLPYRRLRSWMELHHRLYCNDTDLGEIVLDMQDEQAASTVARMMMTLALRLREAEAQNDCGALDAHAVDAQQDVTVVPVPHDAPCGQPSTSFRSRSRRRGPNDGLVGECTGESANMAHPVQDHVLAPMVVTSALA